MEAAFKERVEFYRAKMRECGQAILVGQGSDEKWQNYKELYEYAAKYRLGLAKKGLLLMGTTGTGKTTALEVLNKLFRLRWRTAFEISEAFADRRSFEGLLVLGLYDRGNMHHFDDKEADLIIDELGFEPESVCVFGTRDVPLEKAIDLRYLEWRKHGIKTFFSTNLDSADNGNVKGLISRYSDRTWSRLNEMCEIILINGTDRRMSNKSI